MTGHVTQARDGRAKFGKPSSWSLFKAIKCTSKVITSGGPTISGISCPISIRKCTENKRKLSRVKNIMEESALQVSKNAQNNSIVSRAWRRQILAHLMNSIGDVWTSDCEIN